MSTGVRFWLESALAVLAAVLSVLTVVRPDWIEQFSGVDPDRGSGLAEWLIVAALAAAALSLGLLARAEWRRARAVPLTAQCR